MPEIDMTTVGIKLLNGMHAVGLVNTQGVLQWNMVLAIAAVVVVSVVISSAIKRRRQQQGTYQYGR